MKRLFIIPVLFLFIVSCSDDMMHAYEEISFDASSNTVIDLRFKADDNKALDSTVTGVISGDRIAVTVPYDTVITGLAPTVSHTGADIYPASGFPVDFSDSEEEPVIYTVTSYDGSTREYEVTVAEAASDAKDLSNYCFLETYNGFHGCGEYDGTNITVTVPYSANVAALKASFDTDGEFVHVGETEQKSGDSENNFTDPVTYTVTAFDGSKQDYVVTVIFEPAVDDKEITAFSFDKTINSLYSDAVGVINGFDIAVTVPYGTGLDGLKASFSTTGETVKVGTTTQYSGSTSNNFYSPVTYSVFSESQPWDNPQNYTVTVTEADPFTVAYDINTDYHSSGTAPEDNNEYSEGDVVTVPGNTGNLIGKDVGGVHDGSGIRQRFVGWHEDADADIPQYLPGAKFNITKTTTLYAIYTKGDTSVLRKVGPAGGWVFYDVGDDDQPWGRYLEAANEDQSAGIRWNNGTSSFIGVTDASIGSGRTNTDDIITAQGETADYAARTARACSQAGVNDWHLPSKDELNKMWVNLRSGTNDDDGNSYTPAGGFFNAEYWSSTEYNIGNACRQNFGSAGTQSEGGKGWTYRVRAVRAFSNDQ